MISKTGGHFSVWTLVLSRVESEMCNQHSSIHQTLKFFAIWSWIKAKIPKINHSQNRLILPYAAFCHTKQYHYNFTMAFRYAIEMFMDTINRWFTVMAYLFHRWQRMCSNCNHIHVLFSSYATYRVRLFTGCVLIAATRCTCRASSYEASELDPPSCSFFVGFVLLSHLLSLFNLSFVYCCLSFYCFFSNGIVSLVSTNEWL